MIRLPRIPDDVKELKLRLRAMDYRETANNYTLVYVSPMWLLEMAE